MHPVSIKSDRLTYEANRSGRVSHPALLKRSEIPTIETCLPRTMISRIAIHGCPRSLATVPILFLPPHPSLSASLHSIPLDSPLFASAATSVLSGYVESRGMVAVIAIVQNREWEIVTWLRAILLRPLILRVTRTLNRYSRRSNEDYSFYSIFLDVYATVFLPRQKKNPFRPAGARPITISERSCP